MTQASISSDVRLPAKQLIQRYGVVGRTIDRWLERDDLQFPRPLVINRRRYWILAEIEEWERSRAAARMEAA